MQGEVIIQNFLLADWWIDLKIETQDYENVWLGVKTDFQVGNQNLFLWLLCTWFCRSTITIFLGVDNPKRRVGNKIEVALGNHFVLLFRFFYLILNNKTTAELWNKTSEELTEVYLYFQKYCRYAFDCWGLFEKVFIRV